jgi:hypothetical protein
MRQSIAVYIPNIKILKMDKLEHFMTADTYVDIWPCVPAGRGKSLEFGCGVACT